MVMRITASLAVALAIVSAAPALAAGCGENRDACVAVCTPERIARYYAGVEARCSASCEPRFQQCLRTGVWMHLEDRYAGWAEPANSPR